MDVSSVAQAFGFPAACLVVLGIAIWRVLIWASVRGDRLLERHIAFIDAVEKAVQDQADNQRSQTKILEEQTGLLKKIGAASVEQTKIMVKEHKENGK